jgi:hypothetical protein
MASLPAATFRAPNGTASGRLMIDRKGQAGR